MQKNLVIVESPAKAKTIEKFLGKDYMVTSSYGHIRDLAKKGFGIDIEHQYKPEYEISPDKKKLVADLKKAAKASGNKSAEMIHVKELQPLTGYIRGGCSPIGMKKHYPTYLDEQCILYDEIYISAGIRGMQIKLAPDDLVKVVGCVICELTV